MNEHVPKETSLSVFWISVDKIDPNPFQPRKEFSDSRLNDLAHSVRRYGVLQPLVVTKKEQVADGGDMSVRYELIAGERRLRASKLAGLRQVPAVIRGGVLGDTMRLELAIIENLQREDLNPIDRARAFKRLIDEFSMTHSEVAQRMSRSREYISNSLRLLTLPEDMVQAVIDNKISEGHTRPLLMLSEKPEQQRALFDEIVNRRITVRDSEIIARRQAVERLRKRNLNPRMTEVQSMIEGFLQTRVFIQPQGDVGGRIVIDFFSEDDLQCIVEKLSLSEPDSPVQEEPPAPDDGTDEDDMYHFRNFSL